MRFAKTVFLYPILGALILLTSACETADQRHAGAAPPVHALAPAATEQAPAPATAPAPPVPKEDPVGEIVANAEREYQAGVAISEAGSPEAAKQNLDNAVNILQQAPPELKSDPRLQAQLNKIKQTESSLELDAAQAEDAEQQQPSEPAPIDEANSLTFPVDPKVKAKGEAELKDIHSDLPLVMNDYVAGYLNFFSSRGHGVVERALTRAGRYRPMIERILKEEGVPQDLIYVAQAESGFEPLALSRAGARGMWQFMASRASAYGLERNWWLDERQDPEKATRAAARHLKDLYQEFGDWYLAIAAYNSGPMNVQQAVQRTGFADFWELYKRNVLPKETKNYVPIILAMAIVAKYPAQYGLDGIQPEPPLAADHLAIDYPVDLRLVAQCVDATPDLIRQLNPSLLRMSTPKQGNFDLNLPAGTAQKYQESIAAIPADKRLWWRYHKVADGETLASIAHTYKVTATSITEVNGLTPDEISPSTKLLIPLPVGKHAPGDLESAVYSRHPTRYKVRSGDTISSVADDFNVPAEKLRRWNHIKGDSLRRGRVLVIYRALAEAPPPSRTAHRKYHKKKSLQVSAKPSSTPAKGKPRRKATHPPSSATVASGEAASHQR